jgi:hypothetical protein
VLFRSQPYAAVSNDICLPMWSVPLLGRAPDVLVCHVSVATVRFASVQIRHFLADQCLTLAAENHISLA